MNSKNSVKPIEGKTLVAVDAGGTKTQALVVAGDQKGIGKSTGSNLHNHGFSECLTHIKQAVARGFGQAGHREIQQIDVLCIGLSGYDTKLDQDLLVKRLTQKTLAQAGLTVNKLIIVNDAVVGLRSGVDGPGICLIAGTGSNCYGLDEHGHEAKAGNWGYLLGDQASGYAIGQAMLKQVMKEHDGRTKRTHLTDLVLSELDLQTIEQLVEWSYHYPLIKEKIASLTHLLGRSEIAQSDFGQSLIKVMIDEQTSAFKAVVGKLDFPSSEQLPVVFVGGVFQLKELFLDQLMSKLNKVHKKATPIFPSNPPVVGALKIASQDLTSQLLPKTAIVINF